MPDNPAKDPAGNEKVGPDGKKKGGMLTGKNKWYVIGGLGILAVLVFFFVSRSNANAAAPAGQQATTATGLDPSTQAALETALQGQAGSAGFSGIAGPAGSAGPKGATGPRGKRGKPGKPAPKSKPKNVPPPSHRHHRPVSQFYTVRPGDTLSKIASQHNVNGGWQNLYHMNRGVIGSNPNVIHPGQRIKL